MSQYDPSALKERARQWRFEAGQAPDEALRVFCLNEAEKCDQRVFMSLSTPVFRDEADLTDMLFGADKNRAGPKEKRAQVHG